MRNSYQSSRLDFSLPIFSVFLISLIATQGIAGSPEVQFDSFWVSTDTETNIVDESGALFTAKDHSLILLSPISRRGFVPNRLAFMNEAQWEQSDVDALHQDFLNDRILFSLDRINAVNALRGATEVFYPADVLSDEGGSVPSVVFDSRAAGIPAGVNLDALTIDRFGSLVVSFDRSFFLDGTLLRPGDLVSLSGNSVNTFFFRHSELPDGVNLDAAHRVDNDLLLLSFDVGVILPGSGSNEIYASDHDIVLFNPGTGDFSVAFDLVQTSNNWHAGDLDALHAVRRLNAGEFSFATSFVEVSESVGSIDLTIQRNNGTEGEFLLGVVTSDGSAVAGSDYVQLNETLSWADGDGSDRIVTIEILDDSIQEDVRERLFVELQAQDPSFVVSPGRLELNIIDNDGQNLFSDGFEGA